MGFVTNYSTSHFTINPIDLKLTECTHKGVVNVYTKFEVILTK